MSGVARLHLLPLASAAAAAEARGLDWLSETERHRFLTIAAPERRASFLAGHWQARWLAAQWLQLDVQRIALDAQANGRPLLRVDGEVAPLHVSLSHSGDWLALALADAPVGVDVELPRRERDWEALARFVFSHEEQQRVRDAAGPARAAVFHTLWALKEAHGKRQGVGLQPRAARAVAARPAAEGGRAEALAWAFGKGALALAMAPGTRLQDPGDALGTPTCWCYADTAAGAIDRD